MNWIDVQHELPKTSEDVLIAEFGVSGDNYGIHKGNFINQKWYINTDGISASNSDGNALIYMDMSVTHWMAIPELYLDESD